VVRSAVKRKKDPQVLTSPLNQLRNDYYHAVPHLVCYLSILPVNLA